MGFLALLTIPLSFAMMGMRKDSNDAVIEANRITQQKIDNLQHRQRLQRQIAQQNHQISVNRLEKTQAAEARKKASLKQEADEYAAWLAQQEAYWANKQPQQLQLF
jgi:hypothetical protein